MNSKFPFKLFFVSLLVIFISSCVPEGTGDKNKKEKGLDDTNISNPEDNNDNNRNNNFNNNFNNNEGRVQITNPSGNPTFPSTTQRPPSQSCGRGEIKNSNGVCIPSSNQSNQMDLWCRNC